MPIFKQPNEKEVPIPYRKPGYYIVMLTESSNEEVTYWTGRVWQRIGTVNSFADADFYWIGKTLLTKY